jgi:hypothetical protein
MRLYLAIYLLLTVSVTTFGQIEEEVELYPGPTYSGITRASAGVIGVGTPWQKIPHWSAQPVIKGVTYRFQVGDIIQTATGMLCWLQHDTVSNATKWICVPFAASDGEYPLYHIAASNARNVTGADLVCDGVNDAAQINEFVLSKVVNINTAHRESIIYFTDGDYHIDAPIDLFPTAGAIFGNPQVSTEQLIVLGSGRGITRFHLWHNGYMFELADDGSNAEGRYMFADFTADGSRTVFTTSSNSCFGDVTSGLRLRNLEVKNFAGSAVRNIEIGDLMVDGCVFENNQHDFDDGGTGGINSPNAWITNCVFTSSGGTSIQTVAGTRLMVDNCVITSPGGVGIQSGANNAIITNTVVSGSGGTAIVLTGADSVLSSCMISVSGVIGVDIAGADCKLDNVHVESSSGSSIGIDCGNGTGIDNCVVESFGIGINVPITIARVSITGGRVQSNTAQGINVARDTNDVRIEGVEVRNNAGVAIQIVGQNSFNSVGVLIQNNIIRENGSSVTDYPLYLQMTNAIVSGNLIVNSTGTGTVMYFGTSTLQTHDIYVNDNFWCGFEKLWEIQASTIQRYRIQFEDQWLTPCSRSDSRQLLLYHTAQEGARGMIGKDGIVSVSHMIVSSLEAASLDVGISNGQFFYDTVDWEKQSPGPAILVQLMDRNTYEVFDAGVVNDAGILSVTTITEYEDDRIYASVRTGAIIPIGNGVDTSFEINVGNIFPVVDIWDSSGNHIDAEVAITNPAGSNILGVTFVEAPAEATIVYASGQYQQISGTVVSASNPFQNQYGNIVQIYDAQGSQADGGVSYPDPFTYAFDFEEAVTNWQIVSISGLEPAAFSDLYATGGTFSSELFVPSTDGVPRQVRFNASTVTWQVFNLGSWVDM